MAGLRVLYQSLCTFWALFRNFFITFALWKQPDLFHCNLIILILLWLENYFCIRKTYFAIQLSEKMRLIRVADNLHILALKLCVSDTWEFPERFTESIQLDRKEHFEATGSSACCNLPSVQDASVEPPTRETADHQRSKKEVFTFSSKPRSAPYGRSPSVSPESCISPLELELDSNREQEQTKTEDSSEGTDSSEEVGHCACNSW